MQIIDIRREPPGSTGSLLALFDLQLNDQTRLYNLRLAKLPGGRRRTFAPSAHGARTATFSPALAQQITRAASTAYGDQDPHDRIRA